MKGELSGLHIITAETRGRSPADIAMAGVLGGAGVIQLRDKDQSDAELLDMGRQIRSLTRSRRVLFLVNDRVELAAALGADGVHLGQEDGSLEAARRCLGAGAVFGRSVGSAAEAAAAESEGFDYLGVGPIYLTSGKQEAGEPIGPTGLRDIRRTTRLPLIAIGGITTDKMEELMNAGADGVAVISAVAMADDMVDSARVLRKAIKREKEIYHENSF